MNVKIYGLIDPRTGLIRYVGWTKNSLKKRFTDHLSDARRGQNNYRCKWIRKLLSEKLVPQITVLEETDFSMGPEREMFWIAFFGRENLVNGTDGGEGTSGSIISEETRKKLRNSHLGQEAWNKGVFVDTTHLKEFQFKTGNIPFNKGAPLSLETREKISKTKTGIRINKRNNRGSLLKGVTLEKKSGIWISQITIDKKKHFIGRYSDEETAAKAYDLVSLWASTGNVRLNFPENMENYRLLLSKEVGNLKDLRRIAKDSFVTIQL